MEHTITDTIIDEVKAMPLSEQELVLDFIEDRKASAQANRVRNSKPIWERIVEMSAEIPDEEWAKLPSDGSVNHDHYLYGAPKKY